MKLYFVSWIIISFKFVYLHIFCSLFSFIVVHKICLLWSITLI